MSRFRLSVMPSSVDRPDMRRFGMLFFSFLLLSSQSTKALDFMGWPDFNSLKNPETESPADQSPLPEEQVAWNPWKNTHLYRYRIGSRYAGRENWEHYLMFESHENVRFSQISYGSLKAPDVLVSPSNPVAKIVLRSSSTSRWKWTASLYSPPAPQTGINKPE